MEIIHEDTPRRPTLTFFSLFLFLPPFLAFKAFLSLLGHLFTENGAGKVVLKAGASPGIGDHLAYEYSKQGACLALCARRESALQEVSERARYLGSPEVIAAQADISKVDYCRRLIAETTMDHFGRLDQLVNNVGITMFSKFEEATDITTFTAIMGINYWGLFYTTQFAVTYLRNSCGKIIVLSSSVSWLLMQH